LQERPKVGLLTRWKIIILHPIDGPKPTGLNYKKYLRDLRKEKKDHHIDDFSALGLRPVRHPERYDDTHASPYMESGTEENHPEELVVQKTPFTESLASLKDRLWSFITDVDELEQKAPALFKPVAAKIRDDILAVYEQMEG
jgi:hypothetical protein